MKYTIKLHRHPWRSIFQKDWYAIRKIDMMDLDPKHSTFTCYDFGMFTLSIQKKK